MYLGHHDDGKEKWQSHEVILKDDDFYNKDPELFSHDITDIRGLGDTKEEAIEDFLKKFNYLVDELNEIRKVFNENNHKYITENIQEVDYAGNIIKK